MTNHSGLQSSPQRVRLALRGSRDEKLIGGARLLIPHERPFGQEAEVVGDSVWTGGKSHSPGWVGKQFLQGKRDLDAQDEVGVSEVMGQWLILYRRLPIPASCPSSARCS
jgi:hypothetical protein